MSGRLRKLLGYAASSYAGMLDAEHEKQSSAAEKERVYKRSRRDKKEDFERAEKAKRESYLDQVYQNILNKAYGLEGSSKEAETLIEGRLGKKIPSLNFQTPRDNEVTQRKKLSEVELNEAQKKSDIRVSEYNKKQNTKGGGIRRDVSSQLTKQKKNLKSQIKELMYKVDDEGFLIPREMTRKEKGLVRRYKDEIKLIDKRLSDDVKNIIGEKSSKGDPTRRRD